MEPTNTTTGPAVPPITPIPPRENPPKIQPVRTVKVAKRRLSPVAIVMAIAVLVVSVLAGVSFLAKETVPGDSLYSAKVNIYERAIATTKFTDASKISYTADRINARLGELQSMTLDSGTTSPEIVSEVGALIAQHTLDAANTLNASSLSSEGRMNALTELGTALRAVALLIDNNDELAPAHDAVETARDTIKTSLNENVATFTSSGATSTIEQYLSVRIDALSKSITKVAPGSDAQRIAITRINDASEAIAAGDLEFALSAILRAEEAIAVDGLLYASERGEAPLPVGIISTTTEGQ